MFTPVGNSRCFCSQEPRPWNGNAYRCALYPVLLLSLPYPHAHPHNLPTSFAEYHATASISGSAHINQSPSFFFPVRSFSGTVFTRTIRLLRWMAPLLLSRVGARASPESALHPEAAWQERAFRQGRRSVQQTSLPRPDEVKRADRPAVWRPTVGSSMSRKTRRAELFFAASNRSLWGCVREVIYREHSARAWRYVWLVRR